MYLDVTLDSAQTPVLREVDDFKAFKVVVRGAADESRLAEVLAGVGRVDGDGNAFLAIDAIKRLAGDRSADPEWQRSFDAMVEYARAKGWVDASGAALQAHCEATT